jgi:hypothetical protein
LALFLFLFSVYLLTYSPRFHSSDGLAMFATTESLARRGEWDADQIRWMGLQQGLLGLDGHLYIRKGVGMSALALPLMWLGLVVPAWGPATTILIFNALVTAATGALLLQYLRALGYHNRIALIAALTFGLATLAWPYAKTFFSDPLAALCLVLAALALLRFRNTGRISATFWAGLALAIAVAVRYANVVMIPIYGLLLLTYQMPSLRSGASSSNRKHPISRLQPLTSSLRAWVSFGAPLAVVAIALAFYNLTRYGDPFNTGYLPEESFSGIWWQGIAGMLISPGRGLLLYTPVLLMALLAAPTWLRRHPPEAALAWAIILVHLLLYGKWFMWHGGYAWGPRFLVPTLPFFVMNLTPAIEWGKKSKWWQGSFLALATLSGLIQILGLGIHFKLYQNRLLDTGLPLFAPITFFAPRYSPLIGQFQFLRPEYLDFAWIQNAQVDWPLLIALSTAILISGSNLVHIGKTVYPQVPSGDWPSSAKNGKGGGLGRALRFILSSLVVLAVTAWLLARAHALHPDNLRDALHVLNVRTTAADAVITGTPEESAAFADLYKGRADVLGLNAGSNLDQDTLLTLTETAKNHSNVWWLPNWLPPEQSNVEIWLMRNGFRVEDSSFGERRLALYYFPAQPLQEIPLGETIGGGITLEGADTLAAAHAGDVLPLALHWRASQPLPADYHVFVHLLDAEGNRMAQSDGQPALWTRPTSSWTPGERIQDRHALTLPVNLHPGDYLLITGLYLPQNGTRLVTVGGESSVTITQLRIGGYIPEPRN